MKVDKYNKSLFWQKVFSNINKSLGSSLIIIGIVLLFFNLIIAIILIGIGIFLLIKGGQQRLDYKRKSGYIIHNG